MIENRDFIVFSDDWGRHPSSCQHIFKRIAQKNRVLWVNTIGMRLPRLSWQDLRRITQKLVSWSKPEKKENNNVIIYSPFMTPFSHIRFFRWLNNRLLAKCIKKQLKKHSFQDAILVTTVPNVSDLIGKLGEKKSVYYCVDEFSKWPGMLKETLSKMEEELLERVDLILTTSFELFKSKKSSRCPTYMLSHGVDVEHFRKCSLRETDVPFEIQRIKKPIIGYFGLFDERIDLGILKYISSVHSDWSIVILGKVIANTDGLRDFTNIYFLGSVDYDVVPNYAKAFDVCILPYLINELTLNINPLKLKEYLAIGKPIVTTSLPEAERYADVIKIANSKEDFVRAIETCLEDKNTEMIEKRQKLILDESWEVKAEEFSRYIIEIPEKKIKIMHLRSITGSGGGPEKTILLSCEKIDKNRFDMICVYLKDEKDTSFNITRRAKEKKLSFYEIIERRRVDWHAIRKIVNLLKKRQIDILHCHDYKSDILGFFISRVCSVKLVTTIHGWIRRDLKEKIYVWLDEKFLRYFDKIICVSEVMKKYLLDIGIAQEELIMIHNAIDAEDFKNDERIQDIRNKLSIPKDVPIIGAIGRLSKEKDLESLLLVIKNITSQIKNIRCLIVGEGSEEENLSLLTEKLGIDRNVFFLGQRDDIKRIYKTIDVLVSTSITEGLSNTILEAQAMEIPVVATDVGGNREIIEDNINGFLYKPKDVDNIARGIITLLLDKNKSSQFTKEGRRKICREFSFDERMRKVEKLYFEIMNG